jgi:hypothetical protein
MLERSQLVDLYRTNRDKPVLSVYLDAEQHDFAERRRWRVALKNGVSDQRQRTSDPEQLDRALAHLRDALEDPSGLGFLSGRGWVGFATPDELLYASSLPVPMPDLVRWEKGLRVAPYARALKQARPVVAVLVDSRHARVVRYRLGALKERASLEADTYLGDLSDVSVQKRAHAHTGVRGKTGRDAAQNFLDVERDRLMSRVAEEVEKEVAREGLLVLGGAPRAVDALRNALAVPEERTSRVSSLSFDLSDAEILHAVEVASSELSAAGNERLLERLFEQAESNGAACLGEKDTERALLERRVQTLVFSDQMRARQPDRVDHFHGAALEQDADVVEVALGAASELENRGEGVGALLRYRIDGPSNAA